MIRGIGEWFTSQTQSPIRFFALEEFDLVHINWPKGERCLDDLGWFNCGLDIRRVEERVVQNGCGVVRCHCCPASLRAQHVLALLLNGKFK